jgi:hypothetical protein
VERYVLQFTDKVAYPDLVLELEKVWADLLAEAIRVSGEDMLKAFEHAQQFHNERSQSTLRGESTKLLHLTTATQLYWAMSRIQGGATLTGIVTLEPESQTE